jgi:hypothetical protein
MANDTNLDSEAVVQEGGTAGRFGRLLVAPSIEVLRDAAREAGERAAIAYEVRRTRAHYELVRAYEQAGAKDIQ